METFPRAPITEALLDIRFAAAEEIGMPALLSFHDAISERFPLKEERRFLKQTLKLKPGETPQAEITDQTTGYFFLQADRSKIVQASNSSFSFHKLRPYENWETYREEAKELWGKFLQIAKPESVSQVGLRYINRIEAPLPLKDFRDYCTLFPEIPANLPQGLSELFLRFVMPDPATVAIGIVTVTFEHPLPTSTTIAIILDIDVVQPLTVPSVADNEIWETFERLREYKNRIFCSSTTEAAKNLFR